MVQKDNSLCQKEFPFYVVLQDKSEAKFSSSQDSSLTEFNAIDYDGILSQDHESSAVPSLFEPPINLYPEVRYRFSDDSDDSSHLTQSNSNLNDEDTVVILDFDESGENIVSTRCLSSSWKVYNVHKKANSDISDGTGPVSSLGGPTNLIIQGTNCTVEIPGKDSSASNDQEDLSLLIEDVRNLVQLFNQRNMQLESMVGPSK